MLSQRCNVKLF